MGFIKECIIFILETPFKVPLMRGIKIRKFDKEILNVFDRVKRYFASVVVEGAQEKVLQF